MIELEHHWFIDGREIASSVGHQIRKRMARHMTYPTIYLLGRRVHHGLVGFALVALGLALCWHDRTDRWWLPAKR